MTGEDFEDYVREILEKNGHHAEGTPAKGDYGVDLVLNGNIAVQVKMYTSPVGVAAVHEVVGGKAFYKCNKAWVVTNSTFTPAAVKLAEANKVRLIAGEELQWLHDNPDRTADHGKRYRAAKQAERDAAFAEEMARNNEWWTRIQQNWPDADEVAESLRLIKEGEEARFQAVAEAQALLKAKRAAEAHADEMLKEMLEGRKAFMLILLGVAVTIALIAILLRVA